MNMKLLFFIAFAGISVLSYGLMENHIDITIQEWDLLAMPSEGQSLGDPGVFTTVSCTCNGITCNTSYLPVPPGDIVPHPQSLGANGNELCT